jgi:hypothetical protein
MNERQIEQFARGVGDRAAERLQVERVVSGVLGRLRAGAPKEADRLGLFRRRGTALLRIAAALAVLAGGGLIARSAMERGTHVATRGVPTPVLTGLSSDELEEVFDSLAVEEPVHEFAVGGLESLNEAQLKELLQQMEG